ncbi:actophorin-like [Lineus longissimus]|uniref:actophorin-like n=1 Tax=Lineus longissimus TaxID=88925 RepID=UPI002B4EAE2F
MTSCDSGVQVNDECIAEWEALKLRSAWRYILYKLSDDMTRIEIDKKGGVNSSYEDFIADLPAHSPRYAVFDMHYMLQDGTSKRDKPFFLSWVPETCKVKEKMIAASSKEGIKKKLCGCQFEFQASDFDDLDQEDIINKISRNRQT